MPFYPPVITAMSNKPVICYVDGDVQKRRPDLCDQVAIGMIAEFANNWHASARAHGTQYVPEDTDFMIAFLWTDETTGSLFVDLWIQRQLDSYGECGPMTTLQTFSFDGELVDPWEKGNACAWTRIVSGLEAAHFLHQVKIQGRSVEEYVSGPRPEIGYGMIIPCMTPMG